MLVLAALTGLVRPSDMGLRGALIADTMPPASLTAAMGISRTTSDTARIFGALTGAGLFAAIGIGPSYVAITVFYLLGAMLTWNAIVPQRRARRMPAEAAEQKPSSWHELREGVVLVWNTPRLLAIVWYAFLFNFAVFPLTNGLMPYAAKEIFHTDQTGLGYLMASVAAGAFIGSIIMTRSGIRTELARIMIVAAVIWHVLVFVFAQMDDAVERHCDADAVRLRAEPDHGLPHRDPAERLDAALPRPDHGGADAGDLSLPLGLLAAGLLIGLIGFRATASLYAVVGLAFTVLIALKWRASLWQSRTLAEVV